MIEIGIGIQNLRPLGFDQNCPVAELFINHSGKLSLKALSAVTRGRVEIAQGLTFKNHARGSCDKIRAFMADNVISSWQRSAVGCVFDFTLYALESVGKLLGSRNVNHHRSH